MPFCAQCGANNEVGTKFCSGCGAAQALGSAPVAAAPPSYGNTQAQMSQDQMNQQMMMMAQQQQVNTVPMTRQQQPKGYVQPVMQQPLHTQQTTTVVQVGGASGGPPGSPPGGYWKSEPFCGIITWVVFCFLFWPIVCCPVDTRQVYIAPDGSKWY